MPIINRYATVIKAPMMGTAININEKDRYVKDTLKAHTSVFREFLHYLKNTVAAPILGIVRLFMAYDAHKNGGSTSSYFREENIYKNVQLVTKTLKDLKFEDYQNSNKPTAINSRSEYYYYDDKAVKYWYNDCAKNERTLQSDDCDREIKAKTFIETTEIAIYRTEHGDLYGVNRGMFFNDLNKAILLYKNTNLKSAFSDFIGLNERIYASVTDRSIKLEDKKILQNSTKKHLSVIVEDECEDKEMKQKSDIQEPFLKTKYIDINDNSVTILKSEKKQEDLKNIFKHISDIKSGLSEIKDNIEFRLDKVYIKKHQHCFSIYILDVNRSYLRNINDTAGTNKLIKINNYVFNLMNSKLDEFLSINNYDENSFNSFFKDKEIGKFVSSSRLWNKTHSYTTNHDKHELEMKYRHSLNEYNNSLLEESFTEFKLLDKNNNKKVIMIAPYQGESLWNLNFRRKNYDEKIKIALDIIKKVLTINHKSEIKMYDVKLENLLFMDGEVTPIDYFKEGATLQYLFKKDIKDIFQHKRYIKDGNHFNKFQEQLLYSNLLISLKLFFHRNEIPMNPHFEDFISNLDIKEFEVQSIALKNTFKQNRKTLMLNDERAFNARQRQDQDDCEMLYC